MKKNSTKKHKQKKPTTPKQKLKKYKPPKKKKNKREVNRTLLCIIGLISSYARNILHRTFNYQMNIKAGNG